MPVVSGHASISAPSSKPCTASSARQSRYRVSLKSGTLAASAPFTSELDFVIPSNTVPLTVDTREHDVTFAAPLWGSGAIEKSGSGTLTVLDGTRHRGRIDVKAGALKPRCRPPGGRRRSATS